ncbi:hypothetical protein HZS61_011370 [Fusarium oxysporum f. sp. conglutinans]|uniref:Uncharacterized protein n=1 Tax=Fusarium oxysporum f. sp. conglutinans TaxID=100902 RepID=A0A8H6LP64_FUSOX|nr:hypothetical protein HZS61_011370 [Fusarium oxysporum f. sp. conglutinans]
MPLGRLPPPPGPPPTCPLPPVPERGKDSQTARILANNDFLFHLIEHSGGAGIGFQPFRANGTLEYRKNSRNATQPVDPSAAPPYKL